MIVKLAFSILFARRTSVEHYLLLLLLNRRLRVTGLLATATQITSSNLLAPRAFSKHVYATEK